MNAVNCYVELHGFGKGFGEPQPDWYRAVALNGVEYMNITQQVMPSGPPPPPSGGGGGGGGGGPSGAGIFTYHVDPSDCSASDGQHFDTHKDTNASLCLISYLQDLANGIDLLSLSHHSVVKTS